MECEYVSCTYFVWSKEAKQAAKNPTTALQWKYTYIADQTRYTSNIFVVWINIERDKIIKIHRGIQTKSKKYLLRYLQFVDIENMFQCNLINTVQHLFKNSD